MQTKSGDNHPDRDFGKMFDLDRSTLTKSLVERMEDCMRRAQTAADELKEVVADCREQEFAARDITAMKKIARLRMKDQINAAREQLEALNRVGHIVGFDLFDWADAR